MVKAVVIEVDGTTREIDLRDSGAGGLQDLYAAIGCELVEVVQTPYGDLWVDEEGKLTGRDMNVMATRLWASGVIGLRDWIAGPAVLTGHPTGDGDMTSLEPNVMEALRRVGS